MSKFSSMTELSIYVAIAWSKKNFIKFYYIKWINEFYSENE